MNFRRKQHQRSRGGRRRKLLPVLLVFLLGSVLFISASPDRLAATLGADKNFAANDRADEKPPALRSKALWWDFSGDGQRDLLQVVLEKDERGAICQKMKLRDGHDLQVILAEMDLSILHVWKLFIGDVDGDGQAEIAIPCWKSTVLDETPRRRPFLYRYQRERRCFEPFWRGSRFSLPFEDLTLFDLDGDGRAEWLVIECDPSGGKRLSVYERSGFSFWRVATTSIYDGLRFRHGGVSAVNIAVLAAGGESLRSLTCLDKEFFLPDG